MPPTRRTRERDEMIGVSGSLTSRASSSAPFLRVLAADDLATLVAFEARANDDAWSSVLLDSALNDESLEVWGRFEGKELTAVAIVSLTAFDAELQSISVLPARRRQGVARMMLAHVRVRAEAHGAQRLLLEVRESNLAAQNLYRQTGFAIDGQRRGYYRRADGSGENAVLMSRELVS